MPLTELSQHAITNLGPLTTAFTAPASCATSSLGLYLAFESAFPDRVQPFYRQKCEVPDYGECFPSGAVFDDMRSAAITGRSDRAGTIAYFSPASSCPDQYTTAGVAAKNAEGAVSSSGVFVPPFVRVPFGSGHMSDRLVANPLVNVFMEALDRNETAVVCCPDGYTVGFNGGCFSQVPESVYGPTTTVCLRNTDPKAVSWVNATFTYNNTVASGLVYSYLATSYEVTTQTRTFTGALSDSLIPVASKPAVTMVYNTAVETGAGGVGGGGTAAATGTGAPSAAHGARMTTSGGNLGILVTVWAFAALAGVALAMPL
ncbi:hypothetical protein BDP55DRAFT_731933 [Colletotrichum godetiae]|uniref:Uncharacterized protein n=1 Tax=Colletotrichum godetiae TaxID=1209918 RepID=A0AAJ0EQP0_9PEZI|nr:uncharacterized protein BDP55DRAFT_731933 [Colletotrichum godetiae]KAK1671857.1 hypothetical protein BDP55DRAFT_731933 [Colletotrichum godetiae]